MKEYEGERVATGTITIDGETYDVLLSSPEPKKFGPEKPGQGPKEGSRGTQVPGQRQKHEKPQKERGPPI
jgi:hypothetical protein